MKKIVLSLVVVAIMFLGSCSFMDQEKAIEFNNEIVEMQVELLSLLDYDLDYCLNKTEDEDELDETYDEIVDAVNEMIEASEELSGKTKFVALYDPWMEMLTFVDEFLEDEGEEAKDLQAVYIEWGFLDDDESDDFYDIFDGFYEDYGDLNDDFLDKQDDFAKEYDFVLE